MTALAFLKNKIFKGSSPSRGGGGEAPPVAGVAARTRTVAIDRLQQLQEVEDGWLDVPMLAQDTTANFQIKRDWFDEESGLSEELRKFDRSEKKDKDEMINKAVENIMRGLGGEGADGTIELTFFGIKNPTKAHILSTVKGWKDSKIPDTTIFKRLKVCQQYTLTAAVNRVEEYLSFSGYVPALPHPKPAIFQKKSEVIVTEKEMRAKFIIGCMKPDGRVYGMDGKLHVDLEDLTYFDSWENFRQVRHSR